MNFTLGILWSAVALAQSTAHTPQPKTPWGDPDLQGYYTNKYEYGAPFERPAAFAGRRIDELSAQELAELAKKRQQIVQAPGFVVIRDEMVHDTRVIPLDPSTSSDSPRAESSDNRPNLGKALRFDMGSARGHWEGDTLVVETTNFKQRSAYRNANADTLRLVERFRRTSADRVEWSVAVADPTTWTKPWTFTMPLTRNEEEAVELYECHEGNHAIFNILSAARAAERDKASSESR